MLLLLLAREQIFTLEKAMYAELYRIAIMEGIRILYIYIEETVTKTYSCKSLFSHNTVNVQRKRHIQSNR